MKFRSTGVFLVYPSQPYRVFNAFYPKNLVFATAQVNLRCVYDSKLKLSTIRVTPVTHPKFKSGNRRHPRTGANTVMTHLLDLFKELLLILQIHLRDQ